MIINLAKGRGTWRQPLTLPATAAAYRDAISNLQSTGDSGAIRIADVVCPVSNLRQYIANEDVTDPDTREKLNTLAEKIDAMSDQEAKTCVGALDMTSINGLDDVLRVAGSLKNYIFIHGVTTEKELGRYLVDSGYKGFPEFVQPYLDFAAIGIEYHAEHDGAFTADGYILRRGSAEQLLTKRQRPVVFTVFLQTDRMRELGHDPFRLELPATDAQLDYAKTALDIAGFEEAAIAQVTGLDDLLNNIPFESIDVEQLIGFADEFIIAGETQDRNKLFAALELEKPATLDEAVGIIQHLENYVMIRDTCEEYGRKALLKLTGDQEVVDTVDGFIDWGEFGEQMMQEDGFVLTGCGMIRRVNERAPEQAVEGFQAMQGL